jgi:hypothetical protein
VKKQEKKLRLSHMTIRVLTSAERLAVFGGYSEQTNELSICKINSCITCGE